MTMEAQLILVREIGHPPPVQVPRHQPRASLADFLSAPLDVCDTSSLAQTSASSVFKVGPPVKACFP